MSRTSTLDFIQKNTSQSDPTHCIIWLHGLGADCHDFENITPLLQLDKNARCLFVFPNAPHRPITMNGGHTCRAWYDIKNLDRNFEEDDPGIRSSQAAIAELIEAQINNGIPASNILLAGFSQGGAMALFTGLRFKQPLGGIIALSCYLPLATTFINSQSQKTVPILQCHGTLDNIVPFALGQTAHQFLQHQRYNVEFKQYAIDHQVSAEELADIGHWMKQRLTSPVSLDTLPA